LQKELTQAEADRASEHDSVHKSQVDDEQRRLAISHGTKTNVDGNTTQACGELQ